MTFVSNQKHGLKNTFLTQKGFIGPIGDDLPSLIPIIVALILFFGIFQMTLTTYGQKNLLLAKEVELTSVARLIKGDSLILSVDDFQKNCLAAKVKKEPYSFMAAIYRVAPFGAVDPAAPIDPLFAGAVDDFKTLSTVAVGDELSDGAGGSIDGILKGINHTIDPSNPDGVSQPFLCRYIRIGGNSFSGKEKAYYVRFYPVAVQVNINKQIDPHFTDDSSKNYLIIPAVMAMVVWE